MIPRTTRSQASRGRRLPPKSAALHQSPAAVDQSTAAAPQKTSAARLKDSQAAGTTLSQAADEKVVAGQVTVAVQQAPAAITQPPTAALQQTPAAIEQHTAAALRQTPAAILLQPPPASAAPPLADQQSPAAIEQHTTAAPQQTPAAILQSSTASVSAAHQEMPAAILQHSTVFPSATSGLTSNMTVHPISAATPQAQNPNAAHTHFPAAITGTGVNPLTPQVHAFPSAAQGQVPAMTPMQGNMAPLAMPPLLQAFLLQSQSALPASDLFPQLEASLPRLTNNLQLELASGQISKPQALANLPVRTMSSASTTKQSTRRNMPAIEVERMVWILVDKNPWNADYRQRGKTWDAVLDVLKKNENGTDNEYWKEKKVAYIRDKIDDLMEIHESTGKELKIKENISTELMARLASGVERCIAYKKLAENARGAKKRKEQEDAVVGSIIQNSAFQGQVTGTQRGVSYSALSNRLGRSTSAASGSDSARNTARLASTASGATTGAGSIPNIQINDSVLELEQVDEERLEDEDSRTDLSDILSVTSNRSQRHSRSRHSSVSDGPIQEDINKLTAAFEFLNAEEKSARQHENDLILEELRGIKEAIEEGFQKLFNVLTERLAR